MKKIISVSMFLVSLIILASAPSSINAQVITSTCLKFERNLSQGMRDTDPAGVFGLQTFLVGNGYLSVQPTGFFGSLTLTAVKNFQSDNVISTTGYVGSLTRAKISAITCSEINALGCTSTSGFSITTGRSCTPVAYPVGCASSAGFSSTTGLSCVPTAITTTTTTTTYPEGCASTTGFSTSTGKRCDGVTSSTTTTTTVKPSSSGSSSSSTSSSSSASQHTYPDGCTSFSGSSVTTDMPCDGSLPPEPPANSGCAESNFDPETGLPCE